MTCKTTSCIALVALFVVVSGASGADTTDPAPQPGDYDGSRILVRLTEPLRTASADGSFALRSARPELDRLIVEVNVRKIEAVFEPAESGFRFPERARRYGLDRTYVFHVPEGSDILRLVERFSRLPGVEFAEPDYVAPVAGVVPNDPLFPDQWSLDNPSDTDVDAPEAWEIARGEGVILGIVDTGVDSDHPDLAGKLVPGQDFVNEDSDPEDDSAGHGTGVASIASAITDNGEGIAGACWDCAVMPLKAFTGEGVIQYAAMANALVWGTDHGARVFNMSGGGPSPSSTLLAGMSYAYDAGAVLVSAAGNDGANAVLHPARYLESLAIGATDGSDRRRANSRYGPQLDVVAPGETMPAAVVGGGYLNLSGTSHAAPLVTGLLGVMETVNPALGREEARHLIRAGAEDEVGDPSEDTPGFDIYQGWGRLNMHRTLQATASSITLRVDGSSATRVYFETPNPLASSYDFVRGDLDALSESWAGVELGDVVCLENDSPDADTTGNEDSATPLPGEAFFYLGRFNGVPGAGSYGGSSSNRDRSVPQEQPSLAWAAESDGEYAYFGYTVHSAGDVNDDGYDDVIIGAYLYTNDQTFEGAAFVYLGSAAGLAGTPVWSAEGDQEGARFGISVASAGDVNGDGYDDVIVGAPYYTAGETDEGRAYVYLGNAEGLAPSPAWVAEGDQAEGAFGWRVRPAGDVNNDGYHDVVVVAFYYDNFQLNEGKAFVYYGSENGLSLEPDWTFETDQAEARMAGAGRAGDVNGDGYDDLIVGSQWYDNGQTNEGRVWVFHGSAGGLSVDPAAVREIDVAGAGFGYSSYTAGDVNGDGYDDVIVGAYGYTGGPEQAEGAAFVYLGSQNGIGTSPAWSVEGGQADAWFGLSAETAGDVNDDGYDDVIVSSERYDVTRTDQGRAWVFLGSAAGLATAPVWWDSGVDVNAARGWRSAAAGDVNGDGFDDVIVGDRRYDNGQTDEGRALVYHGPLEAATTTDCPAGGS